MYLNFVRLGLDFFATLEENRMFYQFAFDFKTKQFTISKKASLSFCRTHASLAAMEARYVFISGGYNLEDCDMSKVVERYDS